MRNIQMIMIAIATSPSALIVPSIASAGVILSQDFKSGLSTQERIAYYGALSNFGVHDGYLGHSSTYSNYEDSLYIADLDLTNYRNVMISYDLVTKVEDRYDVFRTEIGGTNSQGRFESAYNVDAVPSSISGRRSFVVPDNRLASQFAFRFVSDHSVPDAGVQVRNLLITGDRIAAPDVPPVAGVVPEPGTWAMMVAGFGTIGGMMRRRKTRRSAPRVLA